MKLSPFLDQLISNLHERRLWGADDRELLRIVKAYARSDPDALDELILIGARSAVKSWVRPEERELIRRDVAKRQKNHRDWRRSAEEYARENSIPIDDVASHRTLVMTRSLETVFHKAEALDHIVELLDLWNVDGKRLGDCTRDDLLRAQHKASREAHTLNKSAALYAKLATLLAANETIRESNQRRAIIEVLREAAP